jgi:hypothetical protein
MNCRRTALPPGRTDEIGPDDIFSQVMGPERSGRLRMCGAGIAPSDIWGAIPTRTTQQLVMADQRDKISMLEELVKEQGRLLSEVRANMPQHNNLSTQSRAESHDTNYQTAPPNDTNSLRVLVSLTKGMMHIFHKLPI